MNAFLHQLLIAAGADLDLDAAQADRAVPLAGNIDRHPDQARHHALVPDREGTLWKLTAARDLTKLYDASTALHRAYPRFTPPPGRLVRTGEWHVLKQPAIVGPSLDTLLSRFETLPRALVAWTQITDMLNAAVSPSEASRRTSEWLAMFERVRALSCWGDAQQHRLARLATAISDSASLSRFGPTTHRWSNGDFTSTNILVPDSGPPCLIDPEHAHETTWHAEDFVRFGWLSPALQAQPALRILLPSADDFTTRFAVMRQFCLEAAENSEAYFSSVIDPRKNAILAVDPRPHVTPWHMATAQLFYLTNEVDEWTETASTRCAYRSGARQLLVFPLTGKERRLRWDPACTADSVLIRQIGFVDLHGGFTDVRDHLVPLSGQLRSTPAGVLLQPADADPQLQIAPVAGARWLIAELDAPTL